MNILQKWTQSSLVLRILIGLVAGVVLGLTLPGWTWIGILGLVFSAASVTSWRTCKFLRVTFKWNLLTSV